MHHFLTRAPYLSALLGTLATFALSGPVRAQVPVSSTYTIMYFDYVSAQGSLVTDGGSLWGATSGGGYAPGGLLYQLVIDPSSSTIGSLNAIYQFGRLDVWNGATPGAGLLLSNDGNLYGTTILTSIDQVRGKISPPGTIFRVSTGGLNYTKLFSFEPLVADSNGYGFNTTGAMQYPGTEAFRVQGSLIEGYEAGVHYLYGTALVGGAGGTGTVYKIRADGTGFQVLGSFGPAYLNPNSTSAQDYFDTNAHGQRKNLNGVNPMERLVLGGDNFVYGVTRDGGANGTGVVFRVSINPPALPAVGTIELLHEFDAIVLGTSSTDPNGVVTVTPDTNVGGGSPLGGMVLSGGTLYGTASTLGPNGGGTVFRIARDGTGFTVLRGLAVADGVLPSGNLIVTNDGMLAGTTQFGGTLPTDPSTGTFVAGSAVGTVYKLSLDGSTFSEQCVFNSADVALVGAGPVGGVVQTSDGSFYGTTSNTPIQNGAYGQGLIYKCGTKYTGPVVGIRPFVDDGGGNLPMWLLAVLTALLGLQLIRQRLN